MFGNAFLKIRSFRAFFAGLLTLPLLAWSVGMAAASSPSGAVYTLTNAAAGNAVQVYSRADNGALSLTGTFPTGGLGTGANLGSQGAIALSSDGQWLFAVNAGSNEISSFSVQSGQLTLMDKVSSGGSYPISLAYYPGLLYVLNAGGAGNITGFTVSSGGHLSPLSGSTQYLSNQGVGNAPSPEEISFNPNGELLAVTEKGSNLIDVYPVVNSLALPPQVRTSSSPAPYGFGFSNNSTLIVSDAAQSAASSYRVSDDNFKAISNLVPDYQVAACWLVVSSDGKFAYVANAGSGNISAYQVSSSGRLSLLDASGITASTGNGSHPVDMALSSGDGFFYVLNTGTQTISAFAVDASGGLSFIANISAPAAASGLAAH
jgi:6-phosphogluconolactonase (cycloisomerase 2 family)